MTRCVALKRSWPDPIYHVIRYQPQWQEDLLHFREVAQGTTSHDRFLANLANPELGLTAWLARDEAGTLAGYATGLPWKRRPGVYGVSISVPKEVALGEQVGAAVALAEAIRRDKEAGGPAQAAGAPAHTLVAFPIRSQWLPAFTETAAWTPFQELVHYRKESRVIPPAPPVPAGATLEVRPFVASTDLAALLKVEHAAFPEFWWQSADEFTSFGGGSGGGSADLGRTFDVMVLNGEIIGYNMNSASPPRGYVGRIGVHPAHQGKGFGHRLLAHALLRLYEAGCEFVELNTQIENAQSRRLYEKFGFEAVDGHWMVSAKV